MDNLLLTTCRCLHIVHSFQSTFQCSNYDFFVIFQVVLTDFTLDFMCILESPSTGSCCTPDGQLLATSPHSTCYPILIPRMDPIHSKTNIQCMHFVRTLTDKDLNCDDTSSLHPAEQMSGVTGFMDLSLTYGNSDEQSRQLRSHSGGRLYAWRWQKIKSRHWIFFVQISGQ